MNETGKDLLASDENGPPSSRGDLYLEKTRMEDEIQELRPVLKRRRAWGIAFSGIGLLNLFSGMATGNLPGGIFGCIVFLVISMVPWLFFGFALSEVRGFERAAAEIESRLSEWEDEEPNGEV